MNWLNDWFGYTRYDKLVTLGMIAVVATLPVSVPLFACYIAARACRRKLFGVEQ